MIDPYLPKMSRKQKATLENFMYMHQTQEIPTLIHTNESYHYRNNTGRSCSNGLPVLHMRNPEREEVICAWSHNGTVEEAAGSRVPDEDVSQVAQR